MCVLHFSCTISITRTSAKQVTIQCSILCVVVHMGCIYLILRPDNNQIIFIMFIYRKDHYNFSAEATLS